MTTERMLWVTLCGTLAVATVGIVALMASGINVKIEATLAVAAGWYKLLDAARGKGTER